MGLGYFVLETGMTKNTSEMSCVHPGNGVAVFIKKKDEETLYAVTCINV